MNPPYVVIDADGQILFESESYEECCEYAERHRPSFLTEKAMMQKFDLFMLHILKNDTQFFEGRPGPGSIGANDKKSIVN